jgi:hypothetical protein
MSAPALFDYDGDDVSPSAPPWLRQRARGKVESPVAELVDRLPGAPHFQRWSEAPVPPPVDLDAPSLEDEEYLRKVLLRRSLDPEPLPPPPIDLRREQRTQQAQRWFIAAALIVPAMFIAVVMLGGLDRNTGTSAPPKSTVTSSLVGASAPKQTLAAQPLLRLPAQNRSNLMNRPTPLGIGVTQAVPGASVVVSGLPVATRLTVGTPSGNGAWRIASGDLDRAQIVPPIDFVGEMALSVDLRLANGAIADRNVVRMSWVQTTTNAQAKADKEDIREPSPAKPIKATTAPDAKPAPVVRDIDNKEIAALIKRATDLISTSNISAARLVLRRAAEGGSAEAAFALAASYDPTLLRKIGIVGAEPDIAKARTWYGKAAALGSTQASRYLEQLAHQAP